MRVISDINEMTLCAGEFRQKGNIVALVPTMGYLHKGHVRLMETAKAKAQKLVLSIFVNPAQFGPNEDFTTYPRDIERDLKTAKDAGVDVVFTPDAAQMYGASSCTFVTVEGLSERLCGASRPGHFRGVATVVLKLFNIVRPHKAVFGKKDFQQFVIIKRLVSDLNAGVEIIGVETVREADGLAMSSRNTYLTADERRSALSIPRSLEAAKDAVKKGQRQSAELISLAGRILAAEGAVMPEYVKICDPETLEDVDTIEKEALLAVAVRVGRTRLIDNVILA